MNALDAMLAQYEKNNAPKYEKQEAKTYDLKNYFKRVLFQKLILKIEKPNNKKL